MNVPIVVLDTNLFVSILLRSAALAPIFELLRGGKIKLIISPAQIAEINEVIHRPRFNFSSSDIKAMLDWINIEATLVTPVDTKIKISRDPKDDFLIHAAIAGDADAIVTGDKDILALGASYEGIALLSPADFLRKFS